MKIKPFKNAPTTASSLKKLTILFLFGDSNPSKLEPIKNS